MSRQALCPVLIGRDEPLSVLEDALLAAGRGDARLVALGGEAGVGKTRLTTELAARARKLGFEVLWGGCSEADLQLPYLPFVEAVGNWLRGRDVARIAEELGAARRELAQIFPQLSAGDDPVQGGDAGQAKLRLLEAAVALLAIPAREHGLVLVIEDVHWADASTRELLDHLARRLTGIRALVVATYRSDEVERRHPLRPLLQAWRRAGIADVISLDPLEPHGVASMIGTILDSAQVSAELRDLIYERSEGNPFVVEEMLKEAIDRAAVYRTDRGWERKPIEQIAIPETVRETILLRVERLDQRYAIVLQAASVLGRTFDYERLAPIADVDATIVEAAVEAAIAQQLIEEDPASRGRFRWRHALTQEAIYTEIMLPKRQHLHERAAAELAARPDARAVELAHHLLEAGRFHEAVPVCLQAAEEAMRTHSFGDAIAALERAVTHVSGTAERAVVIGRLGRSRMYQGESRRAQELLLEAVRLFEEVGDTREAAVHRILLSRTYWEQLDTASANEQLQTALGVLEPLGPSGDLATAYIRLASLALFRLDFRVSLEYASRGAETARAADAEFERLWAESFVAVALMGLGEVDEGLKLSREVSRTAAAKGHPIVIQNACWNEVWERAHLMVGGFDEALDQLAALPDSGYTRGSFYGARASARLREGDLAGALADVEEAALRAGELGMKKVDWRAKLGRAECLLALGRIEEAAATLPDLASVVDPQDYIYEAQAQIGCRLAVGDVDGAVTVASEIAAHADLLAPYRETLAAAAEAFVAAGRLGDARDLIRSRGFPSDVGMAHFDFVEGLIALEESRPAEAAASFATAKERAAERGFRFAALRAVIGEARANLAAGRTGDAATRAIDAIREGRQMGALGLVEEAAAVASAAGAEIPREAEPVAQPAKIEIGERLVTTLFADVRGYTELTSATAPAEMSHRLTSLYRWAKTEVERQNGLIDKFAGDAVMATFNVSGATVDHALHALQAALALRDKAALGDLHIGVGIAVGPAVVSTTSAGDGNLMVMGESTNLAARLQAAAGPGEILLSEEAFRRVGTWLGDRGIIAVAEDLTLKGFDGPIRACRIRAAAQTAAR